MTEIVHVAHGDRREAHRLLRTGAAPADANLKAPGLAVDGETGEPVAFVGRYAGDMGRLRQAFLAYPMGTTIRMQLGIRNRSNVFGYAARIAAHKREACRACSGSREAPGAHTAIVDAGAVIADMIAAELPTRAKTDQETAEAAILPEWRLPGCWWTSGVLNLTAPMPYHYDANNLPTWSAMIVARRNVEGGHLHIPELGLVVECRDGDVVCFPGWRYLHGVTPITKTRADGYRFTAVFYTVKGMAHCLPAAEELARARRTRSAREDTMLDAQAVSGLRAAPAEQALKAGDDFRRPELRRETFHRFYEFHLKYKAHPGAVYHLMPFLRGKLGWDDEEALWFAFLNGNTQNPVTSLIIHRRFPTPGTGGLAAWFKAEAGNLQFDTDRRHHKPKLPEAAEVYAATVRGDQAGYWATAAENGFGGVWAAATALPYFGRLSAFSYAEYLAIMGVPVVCDTLMLGDRPGSRSHRNGLCKVLGRDDLDWHDSNPGFDGDYPPDLIERLTEEAQVLLGEAQARAAGKSWEQDVGYFTLESALCTYKSWFRPDRRYPNVYNDLAYDRIRWAERRWQDEDLSVLWEARAAALPAGLRLEDSPHDPGCVPEKQNLFRETGCPPMMDGDWDCFANPLNDAIRNGTHPLRPT